MSKKQAMSVPENTTVIYGRYSSHNQREESIDAQVRLCMDYANQNNLNIIKVYADSAKTGTNSDREKFQEMISDAQKGMFKVVLVHKLDRFSRDKFDSVYYKRQLLLNGVTLVSVTERMIDNSPESVILESVLEGMADYYSKNLSREVMKGLTESARSAVHLGGIPPLGYDVDPVTRKYVINEEEAKIIRVIFEKYANGVGYNQILDYLNGMGYRTKSYTTKTGKFIQGRPFGKGSLNTILKNEKYAGTYIFNKKLEKDISRKRRPQLKPQEEWIIVENGLPAIVSKEIFDTVQLKVSENAKNGGKYKAKEIYLLTGLVVCGECPSSMQGNARHCGRNRHNHDKPKYVSYRCTNRANKKGCMNTELRREYLESYVLDELNNRLFSESSIKKLSAMLTDYNNRKTEANKDELERANSELSEVLKSISTVVKLVSQSGVSIQTVSSELKELDERKNFLESYISELTLKNAGVQISEEMIVELINRSKEFVRTKNIPEVRNFIHSYIEKVIVYYDTVEVVFKIHVPDDNDTLTPLTSEGNIKEIQQEYIKVVNM